MSETTLWQRALQTPFIAPQPGSLLAEAVTTPDVLVWRDRVHFYVGGISGGHERILTARIDPALLRQQPASTLSNPTDAFAIAVDIGPQDFDSQHVFDPAAVVVNDRVFLYYSAIGAGPDAVGLALSHDGVAFAKHGAALLEGRAPEAIWTGGVFYLFYVQALAHGGYAVFVATSDDGVRFVPTGRPALDVGPPGAWDSFEVTTPRVFVRGGVHYMIYAGGGDPARKDVPGAFGMARSRDLLTWERYPDNPVFVKGAAGAWDDGAIWFGTAFACGDRLCLLYEGGAERDLARQGPALTQVGLAVVDCTTFDQQIAAW
ncbi:MAG: hypothetical protein Kow00120_22250 [Anaerolineae bacterium]